jgi:hypothetical protein
MIHVNRGATSLGVFSEQEVRDGLNAGRFTPTDIGWREGMTTWQPLSQFPEFAAAAAPTVPPVQAGATPTSVPPTAAYAGRTEPLAIWSLVLSIVGLLCCGFIVAVPGIVCGHLAISKIRKEPNLGGTGLAVAGLVIGYVGIAVWVVWLFLFGSGFLQGLAEGMSKH